MKKLFENSFLILKKVLKIQLHKQGATGRANLFSVFLVNYGLIMVITSETELEVSGHVVKSFDRKKGF